MLSVSNQETNDRDVQKNTNFKELPAYDLRSLLTTNPFPNSSAVRSSSLNAHSLDFGGLHEWLSGRKKSNNFNLIICDQSSWGSDESSSVVFGIGYSGLGLE